MRWTPLLVGVVGVAVGVGSWVGTPLRPAAPAPAPAAVTELPGGRQIDANQVSTGRLSFERMPSEVTHALELHSGEIVKTAELVLTKQARITGTCPPGAAIRVVQEDGRVVCQRLGRGVTSVSALTGIPRRSTTGTSQGAVEGGLGRFQTEGEDDFLVIPLNLPDGVIVTSFSFTYWDNSEKEDGGAFLYRSDDVVIAELSTDNARSEVRTVTTEAIGSGSRRIDNATWAYVVYMSLSRQAGQNLMPIAASVTYRLP